MVYLSFRFVASTRRSGQRDRYDDENFALGRIGHIGGPASVTTELLAMTSEGSVLVSSLRFKNSVAAFYPIRLLALGTETGVCTQATAAFTGGTATIAASKAVGSRRGSVLGDRSWCRNPGQGQVLSPARRQRRQNYQGHPQHSRSQLCRHNVPPR